MMNMHKQCDRTIEELGRQRDQLQTELEAVKIILGREREERAELEASHDALVRQLQPLTSRGAGSHERNAVIRYSSSHAYVLHCHQCGSQWTADDDADACPIDGRHTDIDIDEQAQLPPAPAVWS